MKKVLLLLLVSMPMFVFSQNNTIEKIYSKYKGYEKTTTLSFGGGLIKLAASFEEEEDLEILEKISQVRLMVVDENLVTPNDYKVISKDLKKDAFEDLMQINAEGTKVDILVREQGSRISDIILLVNDDGEFIMISIEGDFEYSDLNDINLNFDGGNYLKKLPENRKSIPKA